MNIKIAEFMRVLDRGGIESFVFENLKRIDGMDFSFIVIRDEIELRENELPSNAHKDIVIIKSENKNKVINTVERFIKFFIYFSKTDYDIIHFQAVSPGLASAAVLLAAKLSKKKNIILHSHMGTRTEDICGIRRLKWLLGRYSTSVLADVFVACSDMAVNYGFSPKELKKKEAIIIKNGIDTKKFRFDPDNREYIRKKLGIEKSYVLGSVARFAVFKNHEFMIDVLYELLCLNENACLLLVGDKVDGEEDNLEKIKDRVKKLGIIDKVIFYGPSTHPEQLLQAMDVFLMPSTQEGFGIAALEAQCTGLKVLASDRITSMLKSSDNISFLPLEDGAKKWAYYANVCNEGYNRHDYSDIVKNNGFDIEDTSKALEILYWKLCKKEDNCEQSC